MEIFVVKEVGEVGRRRGILGQRHLEIVADLVNAVEKLDVGTLVLGSALDQIGLGDHGVAIAIPGLLQEPDRDEAVEEDRAGPVREVEIGSDLVELRGSAGKMGEQVPLERHRQKPCREEPGHDAEELALIGRKQDIRRDTNIEFVDRNRAAPL